MQRPDYFLDKFMKIAITNDSSGDLQTYYTFNPGTLLFNDGLGSYIGSNLASDCNQNNPVYKSITDIIFTSRNKSVDSSQDSL